MSYANMNKYFGREYPNILLPSYYRAAKPFAGSSSFKSIFRKLIDVFSSSNETLCYIALLRRASARLTTSVFLNGARNYVTQAGPLT